MNRKHYFFILIIAWLLANCGARGETEMERAKAPNEPFFDFPDSLFYGIYFNQRTDEAETDLVSNGFELIDSSGSLHYYNRLDSTEVILSQENEVTSLKIILRSSDHLYLRGSLSDYYALSATSTRVNADFTVHYFEQHTPGFKITIFDQEDFIRLNFELTGKKI